MLKNEAIVSFQINTDYLKDKYLLLIAAYDKQKNIPVCL